MAESLGGHENRPTGILRGLSAEVQNLSMWIQFSRMGGDWEEGGGLCLFLSLFLSLSPPLSDSFPLFPQNAFNKNGS